MIGDVYYNRKKRGVEAISAKGTAVYTHPDDATVTLKRRVRVFERYTRERAAILHLPGMPFSGQPKTDLEIDRDVSHMNQARLKILMWYSLAWTIFCALAPIYILRVLKRLDANEFLSPLQPDINLGSFPISTPTWDALFEDDERRSTVKVVLCAPLSSLWILPILQMSSSMCLVRTFLNRVRAKLAIDLGTAATCSIDWQLPEKRRGQTPLNQAWADLCAGNADAS